MKSLLFFAVFLLFFATSCDEDNCKDGELDYAIEASIKGLVRVQNQNGSYIEDYPVEVKFQKHFCDGAVGYLVEYDGETDLAGAYSRTQDYEFTNRKDEVHVQLFAGEGANRQEYINILDYKLAEGGATVMHLFTVAQ